MMEQRQLKFSCTLCSQAVQELFSSLHNLSILRAFTFSSCGSEVKRKWLETLQGHNAFYPLIEHSEDTLGYTAPHATPTKGNLVNVFYYTLLCQVRRNTVMQKWFVTIS